MRACTHRVGVLGTSWMRQNQTPGCRERVLFIGTQCSILYTSMYSPAEAATRILSILSGEPGDTVNMLVLCSAAQPSVHFCVHAWWVFGSEDGVRAYLSLRARSVRCKAFECVCSRLSWYTSALTHTTHANKHMHTNTHITHAHRRQQIRLGTADTRGACSSLLASSIRLQPPSDPLTPSRTLYFVARFVTL